ncbi:MAG TPA: hypothetical protein VGL86_03995 [Polyangia bacterium]|jgi:hypothetical protein
MDKRSLVKVFLHDRGEDVESAWCQPAGPSLFRLVNVPFLHAKPTYGDVVAAERNDDGNWAWDRRGVAQKRIDERLHQDGGRYAIIVDYTMWAEADFGALLQALEKKHDIVGEGCFGPRGEEPGRVYLAAPRPLDPAAVMAAVTTLGRGFRFTLIHPLPPKKKPGKKKPPMKKQAAAKKPKPRKNKATKKKATTKAPAKRPRRKK